MNNTSNDALHYDGRRLTF